MDTVLVTVITPLRSLDLELDARCAIVRLLPIVVSACFALTGDAVFRHAQRWQMGNTTNGVFLPGRCLADYDVWDGTHVMLQDENYWREYAH